jgi:hypothetical protein
MHAANLAVVLPLRAGTGHGQLRSLSSRAYELLPVCAPSWSSFELRTSCSSAETLLKLCTYSVCSVLLSLCVG